MIRYAIAALLAVLSLPAGATLWLFKTDLSGAAEFPPNASPGSGIASVLFDDALHTLRMDTLFSDLIGTTTVAHIHCCVSPDAPIPTVAPATQVPSFTGFPTGVSAGTYSHLFDTTDPATFNPSFVTANGGTAAGAELALLAGLLAGEAYFNIHTTAFPGGEIRGFLHRASVPIPGTSALLAGGLLALTGVLGRRKTHCLGAAPRGVRF